jgi:hypothetical protein
VGRYSEGSILGFSLAGGLIFISALPFFKIPCDVRQCPGRA